MAKQASAYVCSECGWQTAKWVGRCGECQQWGTVTERAGRSASLARTQQAQAPASGRAAAPITAVTADSAVHTPTGISEFDRVLGGGLVPGAAVLLSGEPGVGKSTLLLLAAAKAAARGERVLYVSGEESVGQVRMRASRTDALYDELYLASETDLASVLGHIAKVQPRLVIVDSVQTLASAEIDGTPGAPAQVREVAAALIRVAKEQNVPVIIVGHVTKDGSVAGPRVLEHLVDVVCHFEGDRQTALRFLRTLKNRFGPTDEVGCFEMVSNGIAEVPDPSGLFLARGSAAVSGTCTTVTLEGRRALLAEIQALVAPSATPNPRRITSGVDGARVAMILAVLERRLGLRLHDKDVYVSTVGGMKITEPAADLAIAFAVASAASDKPLPGGSVAFGEISLAGEIRPVLGEKQRKNEAARLGYSEFLTAELETLRNAVGAAWKRAS